MADETIVAEVEVAEFLGVSPDADVTPRLRPNQVRNIGVLNALGDRWLHARDVLGALHAFADSNDLPLLRDVARQIAEGTNTRFDLEVRI